MTEPVTPATTPQRQIAPDDPFAFEGPVIARKPEVRKKSGGLFWRKQAAIRFATRSAWPARCATIFPAESIELDLENQGNPLLSHIGVTRMLRVVGVATGVLLMMAVLAGLVALRAEIFLSRVKY